MKFSDLELLVECARSDETSVYVRAGLGAAKERLLRLRLVEQNPSVKFEVRITPAGCKFVLKLLKVKP